MIIGRVAHALGAVVAAQAASAGKGGGGCGALARAQINHALTSNARGQTCLPAVPSPPTE